VKTKKGAVFTFSITLDTGNTNTNKPKGEGKTNNNNNNSNNIDNKNKSLHNRILLVDNEPDITTVFTLGLEDHDFKVDGFNDP
jgi:hypothetical protein